MGEVRLPKRDEDRRAVFYAMLHIAKKAGAKFTVQELEKICLERGYLKSD